MNAFVAIWPVANKMEDEDKTKKLLIEEVKELHSQTAAYVKTETKCKQKKEEVKKSEERFKVLLESAPIGIYYNDFSGRFLYGNPKAEEIIGYKKEELIGKSFLKLKLLPPRQIKKAAKLLALNRLGKATGPDELTLIRKNGAKRNVEITTRLIVLDGKKVVMGMVQDVTDRKQMEKALNESGERFRLLFEGSPDAIFLADPESGEIIDANPAATHMLLKSRKEIIGLHYSQLHPPRMEKYSREKFAMHARQTGLPIPVESVVLRSDGSEVPVEVLAQKLNIEGKPVLQGIFRNITERKQAEEQIKASLREKEVLLKELHHRVKNNVQIMASLLRLQTRSIKNERMQEMVRGYLSRIHSIGLIHEKLYQSEDLTKINLSQYIRSIIVHLFQIFRVDTNIIKLKTEIEDVFLDINKAIPCGLLINELVSNSLKHAFPKGKRGGIHIIFNSTIERKALLVVKDTGAGFPKNIDFRNPESLGLQLVNDLVNQIDGTIEINRENGTEVKIVF